MVISKQNGADYAIYYDGSVPAFAYGAEMLAKHFEKSAGVVLGEAKTAKNYIVLGACDKSEVIVKAHDLSVLGTDGFYIAFEDGNIYIFGNTPVACVYGVYEFLERYIGVRFLNVDTFRKK